MNSQHRKYVVLSSVLMLRIASWLQTNYLGVTIYSNSNSSSNIITSRRLREVMNCEKFNKVSSPSISSYRRTAPTALGIKKQVVEQITANVFRRPY